MTNPRGCEGIYFVVRYPRQWTLVSRSFESSEEDVSHYDWWQASVAGLVADRWARILKKDRRAVTKDFDLLTYAFPRGRVSKVGRRFTILYGADLTEKMGVLKRAIEKEFGVSGRCTWQFDEHEQCQMEDKEEIREHLRLREDWSAV